MPGNDLIFVSHAHADNELCAPLLQALTAWGADYWFDIRNAAVGQVLTEEILQALHDRDVLLRICTPAAAQSVWMQRELGMFLAFQVAKTASARERQQGGKLISVCFPGYEPDVLEQSYLHISTTGRPEAAWLDQLRIALGKPMGWVRFDRSDADYLWWVHAYEQGYVVNADRRPRPHALTLHRAHCGVMRGPYPPGTFTERDAIKICAATREDLETWALQEVGESAHLADGCACIQYPRHPDRRA
jgi:TIR domain